VGGEPLAVRGRRIVGMRFDDRYQGSVKSLPLIYRQSFRAGLLPSR